MAWRSPVERLGGSAKGTAASRPLPFQSVVSLRPVAVALLVAAGYYAGAILGFALTPTTDPVSTLWPPNAILMACLLLTPERNWWILVAAVLPAHLLVQLPLGIPVPLMMGWFVTNISEALLGAVLFRPYMTRPFFGTVRQVTLFVMFAGILAPLATSFLDAAVVVGTDWSNDYWATFRMRFVANVLAILTVVPAIVMTASSGMSWLKRSTASQYLEAGALALSIVLVAKLAFDSTTASPSTVPALIYTPLPLLIWAAVRFGPGGLSAVLLLFALLSISSAIQGRGPFTHGSVSQNVLALQAFFILITVPFLTLAALIRERRRSEQALRESEERIGLAAETAKLGFWSWDPSMPHVWITDEARRMHGLSAEAELTWKSFVETARPENRRLALQALGRSLPAGGPYSAEYRQELADGSIRWIEERALVVPGADDDSARVTGVVIDVTEQKRAQLEAKEQFRQVTHLARVGMLGELSGALAHELNQPLTAILSNAQVGQRLLERPPVNLQELAEILRDIVDSDRRAGQVIQRLRALLRKGDSQLQPLDLNEIVRDVLDIDHSDLVTRNVDVVTRLAPTALPIQGDRVQLQQVLLNLVLNACEAMSANPLSDRHLTIVTGSGRKGSFEVSVADQGAGVETDRADLLFQPFFTTKEQGLGLGLTICRSIVRAHNGDLRVTNNADRGATFYVSLPAGGEGGP
jgi:PAS domain S-box-containing protein